MCLWRARSASLRATTWDLIVLKIIRICKYSWTVERRPHKIKINEKEQNFLQKTPSRNKSVTRVLKSETCWIVSFSSGWSRRECCSRHRGCRGMGEGNAGGGWKWKKISYKLKISAGNGEQNQLQMKIFRWKCGLLTIHTFKRKHSIFPDFFHCLNGDGGWKGI